MTKLFKVLLFSLLAITVVSACTPKASNCFDESKLASMSGMPAEVKSAAKTVQTAYQFAVANPEALKIIPCYCGCETAGHHSNYAC
jgi:outer membrane lipoprotein-sorting protein